MANMKARMTNIASLVPDAMKALTALKSAADGTGVPPNLFTARPANITHQLDIVTRHD